MCSDSYCQFTGQWFYEGKCLRKNTSFDARFFVDNVFPYCFGGHWMYPGNAWDQPNELVQSVNIVANTQDKIKNGNK